jgi:hypothetical protein
MILSYRTRRRISSSPGAHFPAFFRTPCRTHCLLVPSLPSPFVTQPPRKFDPFRFPGSSLPFRHQGTGRSLPQPYPLSAPSGALIDVDVLLPRDLSPYGQFEDQNRRATCEAWDVPPIMVHTSPIMKSPLLAIRPLYPAVRRQGIRITPAKLQDRIQEGTKDNKRLFFFFISHVWVAMAQIGTDRGLINLYRGGGLRAALPTLRIVSETSHRLFRGQGCRQRPT